MRKAIAFIVFLFVLGIGGYFILQKYFPNLVPPSKDIKQFLPATEDTDTSLKFPSGYKFDYFADLRGEQPRVLAFDSRGTLFVSLTNVGKIVALPDFDGNLRPEKKLEIITGLNKPHGIEFNASYLYVAETNKVSRYKYNSATMTVGAKEILFNVPGGGKDYVRTIKINGDKLYTSVGSTCDTCVEKDNLRASILVSNLNGSNLKVYAKGLQKADFFDFDKNGKLWSIDKDELNLVEEGKDYGWPYCYGDGMKDYNVPAVTPVNCEITTFPKYKFISNSEPLGIAFDSIGNLIVSLHGSTISGQSVGYKLIKLSLFADSVANEEDYITGFVLGTNEVLGRPTGIAIDKKGNTFIADDKSAMIYVLSK